MEVMKYTLKNLGKEVVGKIDKGMFVIQDSATKRDIDLEASWDTCFYPGQHVEMSIIFIDRGRHSHALCPMCEKECTYSVNIDCKWYVLDKLRQFQGNCLLELN